jgi:hypothetical protein
VGEESTTPSRAPATFLGPSALKTQNFAGPSGATAESASHRAIKKSACPPTQISRFLPRPLVSLPSHNQSLPPITLCAPWSTVGAFERVKGKKTDDAQTKPSNQRPCLDPSHFFREQTNFQSNREPARARATLETHLLACALVFRDALIHTSLRAPILPWAQREPTAHSCTHCTPQRRKIQPVRGRVAYALWEYPHPAAAGPISSARSRTVARNSQPASGQRYQSSTATFLVAVIQDQGHLSLSLSFQA